MLDADWVCGFVSAEGRKSAHGAERQKRDGRGGNPIALSVIMAFMSRRVFDGLRTSAHL